MEDEANPPIKKAWLNELVKKLNQKIDQRCSEMKSELAEMVRELGTNVNSVLADIEKGVDYLESMLRGRTGGHDCNVEEDPTGGVHLQGDSIDAANGDHREADLGQSQQEHIGVLSAEDGVLDSLKENLVDGEKDVPHILGGLQPKAGSSGGEKTGYKTEGLPQQHHEGGSANCHDGTELTLSKDELLGQVNKKGPLAPFGEGPQSSFDGGSCPSERPVDEQGNRIGGTAPNGTTPGSAKEDTREEISSEKDRTGQAPNRTTVAGGSIGHADKKNEHANREMDSSQHAQDKNAEIEKCNETLTAVENDEAVHSPAADVPFFLDFESYTGVESGTEEKQFLFMEELGRFYKEKNLEFKSPKLNGRRVNCLELWRAVIKLGGYDRVTICKLWCQVGQSFNIPKTCTNMTWSLRNLYEKTLLEYEKQKVMSGELHIPFSCLSRNQVTMCKLWHQVGESFNPPKTCTSLAWLFRNFYEKTFLEYEKQKKLSGELQILHSPLVVNQDCNVTPVSGKAERDSAIRSIKNRRSPCFRSNNDVPNLKLKERSASDFLNNGKNLENIGGVKRKKASSVEYSVKHPRTDLAKSQMDVDVTDVGAPANWVKINVTRNKECFKVYALIPGLLREEVRVQTDAKGEIVISGKPKQPHNPWGITAFKKIISLPSRIDPYQTSAVVSWYGQLFVRAPFEHKAS